MASFTHRQATPKKDDGHRGSIRKFESSDEDDSSDQSDSDDEQSWKRQKTTSAKKVSHRMPFSEPTSRRDQQGRGSRFERPDHYRPPRSRDRDGGAGEAGKRRKNNVWGSVAVDQNQEAVEREITHFGVDQVMERDVESYSYKDTEQLPLGVATNIPPEDDVAKGRRLMKAVGENEDDAWLADDSPRHSEEEEELKQPHDDLREKLKKRGSMVADRFRRSNIKNRLGTQSDNTEQVIMMKKVEIDPNAEMKVIAGQVAYSLQEPKRDLILRVVKILGVKKTLELWSKTEEIENDGGMMIMNRSRRRSPGGVFIQMMKLDADVSSETVKDIFSEEKKVEEAERKKKRRHTRKSTALSKEGEDDHHGNKEDEAEMEDLGDGGGGERFEGDGDGEPSGEMDMKDEHGRLDDEPYMNEMGPMPSASSSREAPNMPTGTLKSELPLPQQECTDMKEDSDSMMFPKLGDLPKKNEDSDPEDGEVLDDDDD
ncbi:phosphorylated adapter RNA export protein-like [Strongylocentrotus purpuratus]|uniref:Phosphorylated adapter RNA export protein n=1 Tax=Strongylocentrotus purpuratus TaxID=7668 RepID=A0A7M7SUT3_STRPU|nr:phosphorylated adapter RNA export protein-like [Strongylocentrotus purpuratus]|eukprot:XP_003723832.1 PREDICTED: phosphorylated adapter RNA export protein [Strongylocentrotus purpuratus]